jgi:hypothetical protein
VRHELLPYLEERFNPQVRATLARSAQVLADESDALGRAAARLVRRARAQDPGGPALSRQVLRAAPPAVAALAIRRLLAEAGGLRDVGASHVRRLLGLVNVPAASGRRLPLPDGRVALVRFDRLVIARASPPAAPFAVPLAVPGRVAFLTAARSARSARRLPHTARQRRRRRGVRRRARGAYPAPGRPHPLPRGRDISLKRYLLDRRVPADLRPGLPLVADGRPRGVGSRASRGTGSRSGASHPPARHARGEAPMKPDPDILFPPDAIARRIAAIGAEIGSTYEGRSSASSAS